MALYGILRTKLHNLHISANVSQLFSKALVPAIGSNSQWQGTPTNTIQTRGKGKIVFTNVLPPLKFDSGDLVGQQKLNDSEILFKYRDLPDIDSIPEDVKKTLTVAYASGLEKRQHRQMVLQEKLDSVVGQNNSFYEKQIAYLTVKIRDLLPHVIGDRRNKFHKRYLIERIAKRKKILGYLRKTDYDRFQWLCKELQVTWKPYNEYDYFRKSKPTRRNQMVQAVFREVIDMKTLKMRNLREKMDDEKKEFFKEKENLLKEIDQDIKDYKLDKSQILKTFEETLAIDRQKHMDVRKKPTGRKKVNQYIVEQKIKKELESRVV